MNIILVVQIFLRLHLYLPASGSNSPSSTPLYPPVSGSNSPSPTPLYPPASGSNSPSSTPLYPPASGSNSPSSTLLQLIVTMTEQYHIHYTYFCRISECIEYNKN